VTTHTPILRVMLNRNNNRTHKRALNKRKFLTTYVTAVILLRITKIFSPEMKKVAKLSHVANKSMMRQKCNTI